MRLSVMPLAVVVVCLAMPAAALADTVMWYKAGSGQSANTVKMFVRSGDIRINDPGSRYMLYKGGKDTLYIVQPDKQAYTVIDRKGIKMLGQRMQQVRKRYEQQLQKLPKDKRAQVEKQLGPLLHANKEPVTFSRTGGTSTVAGHKCYKGVARRGGKSLQTLCVARPSELGLSGGEYGTIKKMYGLMASLEQASGFVRGAPDIASLKGVPIAIDMGKKDSKRRQVLEKVSHKHLSDALFQLPQGYTSRDLTGQ